MKLFIIVRKLCIVSSLVILSIIFFSCQKKEDNQNAGDYPNDSALYFWANIGDSAITNEVYNFKATHLYTSVNDSSIFIDAFDDKGQQIAIFFDLKKNSGNFPREGNFSINYNINRSVDIIGYGSYLNRESTLKDYSTIYYDDWESPGRYIEFYLSNFDGKTISGQFSMDPPAKDSPQTFISIKCFFNKVRLNMKNEKI
jgi:hypothetical protein